MTSIAENFKSIYFKIDARYIVPSILLTYNILGMTVLGFNRSWSQVLLTISACILLHIFYDLLFNKKFYFPISAVTTSLGLSILVNYGHSMLYPLVPVFFAISSKFFFNFRGRHTFNPAMMGVALSLLIASEMISSSPAYQWNGLGSMAVVIVMSALLFFMPKINRSWLVGTFLVVFTIQIILRSVLIRHYLPFSTLFFGTITSPSFFLFTFFMITDPMTSPSDKNQQIIVGASLAILDLVFHLFSSYHTFFFAAFTLGSIRLTWFHFKASRAEGGLAKYFKIHFFESKYYLRFFAILAIGFGGYFSYQYGFKDSLNKPDIGFTFEVQAPAQTGMHFTKGEVLDLVDPRVQHMGKWILAITDGVAVGDFDNDGLVDVFYTSGHKSKNDRNSFFKNMGNFHFQRFPSEVLSFYASDIKRFGIPSNAMFVDFDNDGDLDLFVTYAFGTEGTSRLFKNTLIETGKVNFINITDESNLNVYSNAATANFFDMNSDGKLDLLVGNTIATHLPDYKAATRLNLFELPPAEYEGDKRPFNFMHDSWHKSENGSTNHLFIQVDSKKFKQLDSIAAGMPETKWSMAIGTGDFNQDGWTDIYIANDFGADDFYYNRNGLKWESFRGPYFGTIGKDTYKGMNVTLGDFDNNGWMDIDVSNVHHQLQAEGTLLFYFYPNKKDSFYPEIKDQATFAGALNENRFGWGAGAADFNNDGWVDMAQANGMVDDMYDKKSEDCPDYWYINEKIARSSPDIHRYINNWGDIRGTCIHGKEKNRLYLNRGIKKMPQFIDVAEFINMDQIGNWRGMATADFDNDGQMDLIASSLYRDPLVFKNVALKSNIPKENHWVGLKLESINPSCNRMAIGTKIWLTVSDPKDPSKKTKLFYETTLVNGFSAQHDQRVHLGLGKNTIFEEVKIAWCGKKEMTMFYSDLRADEYNVLIFDKLKAESKSE